MSGSDQFSERNEVTNEEITTSQECESQQVLLDPSEISSASDLSPPEERETVSSHVNYNFTPEFIGTATFILMEDHVFIYMHWPESGETKRFLIPLEKIVPGFYKSLSSQYESHGDIAGNGNLFSGDIQKIRDFQNPSEKLPFDSAGFIYIQKTNQFFIIWSYTKEPVDWLEGRETYRPVGRLGNRCEYSRSLLTAQEALYAQAIIEQQQLEGASHFLQPYSGSKGNRNEKKFMIAFYDRSPELEHWYPIICALAGLAPLKAAPFLPFSQEQLQRAPSVLSTLKLYYRAPRLTTDFSLFNILQVYSSTDNEQKNRGKKMLQLVERGYYLEKDSRELLPENSTDKCTDGAVLNRLLRGILRDGSSHHHFLFLANFFRKIHINLLKLLENPEIEIASYMNKVLSSAEDLNFFLYMGIPESAYSTFFQSKEGVNIIIQHMDTVYGFIYLLAHYIPISCIPQYCNDRRVIEKLETIKIYDETQDLLDFPTLPREKQKALEHSELGICIEKILAHIWKKFQTLSSELERSSEAAVAEMQKSFRDIKEEKKQRRAQKKLDQKAQRQAQQEETQPELTSEQVKLLEKQKVYDALLARYTSLKKEIACILTDQESTVVLWREEAQEVARLIEDIKNARGSLAGRPSVSNDRLPVLQKEATDRLTICKLRAEKVSEVLSFIEEKKAEYARLSEALLMREKEYISESIDHKQTELDKDVSALTDFLISLNVLKGKFHTELTPVKKWLTELLKPQSKLEDPPNGILSRKKIEYLPSLDQATRPQKRSESITTQGEGAKKPVAEFALTMMSLSEFQERQSTEKAHFLHIVDLCNMLSRQSESLQTYGKGLVVALSDLIYFAKQDKSLKDVYLSFKELDTILVHRALVLNASEEGRRLFIAFIKEMVAIILRKRPFGFKGLDPQKLVKKFIELTGEQLQLGLPIIDSNVFRKWLAFIIEDLKVLHRTVVEKGILHEAHYNAIYAQLREINEMQGLVLKQRGNIDMEVYGEEFILALRAQDSGFFKSVQEFLGLNDLQVQLLQSIREERNFQRHEGYRIPAREEFMKVEAYLGQVIAAFSVPQAKSATVLKPVFEYKKGTVGTEVCASQE